YGSPEDAKDEKDDLLEDFDYYSDKLTECLAKPTPTINCLSIYCDNNNVVTAEFAGDIRDESIVDYRLEIKIDDGDWTYITCSSEPTCNLSQSSCCLTLSQSDETFQATVRYQGQAGKSYSIRMEVENENGWSDWATCSQEQCQIRGNIPPSEESNLLIDTSLPVLADSFGEVISEELKAGLGIALLGATEDQLVNIEITDDEITRSINSLILESPKQFPFENPEIKFETIKISAHILRPVEGNLTLIGELTKKNEKSVNFKIKKGSFNNSLISENLLRQIERKFEERINNFLANIPGLKIESLEVKNGKLVFKGKANQIYVEIEKIITQIKKEDPELIALFLNYLNDRPNDAKGIEKVIKAFQQIESQSLSGSEHSHLVISGKGFTSEKLSCDLPYPFYSKQFKKVFENIVNNDWSETGNWENDWEAVNDAGSFAPFILYKCADKHQNKELERRANKTIDYEISVIDEILKESYNSPEIITKAGGGQYALIAGREHYSGNNKAKVKIYSRIMAIGPSLILIYRPELVEDSLVGAVASISSVANYDFWLAEITKNETERRLYIKLGQCLIDKSLEKYWQEDEYGKYYKSNFYHGQPSPEGPVAFEQGMPLNALARGYKLTGSNPDYFSKIKAIKNTLDQNLWDSQKKGYFEAVGKNIKFLSSHNFITKGYLLWYETTKDEDFLIKATEIFDFIMEDLYSEDYEVFLHDTYTTSNYCSGCNFLTLDNLWRTSEIVK
ncbi:MAG: AGE family epimerase/isomerase, partial [Candidatus Heimdallarchaeaceae archaeon]